MRLLERDYDPTSGITEETWYDDHTGRVTLRRLQDVDSQLEENRELYNMHNRPIYTDSKGGAHKVATIPRLVIEEWKRTIGFDWFHSTDKERRAILNKPENRKYLVRPGRL
jgi:hypothetical protein